MALSRGFWIALVVTLIVLALLAVALYFLITYFLRITCSSSRPCPSGQICVGGVCLTQGCDQTNLCPPGQICVNGVCVTPQCDSNTPCPGDQLCVNGQCVEPQPCGPNNPCPAGQQCIDGQCVVPNTYVKDIIAQTSRDNYPQGYVPISAFGNSNGDLKQGTGGNTPSIFLFVKKDNTTSPPLTDVTVFQFPSGAERACPSGSRLTYRYEGADQYDFEKGCGPFSPVTKICVTYGGSSAPITDVGVTAANSGVPNCPNGYSHANVIDDTSGAAGNPGDLNRVCGGQSVFLCVSRST